MTEILELLTAGLAALAAFFGWSAKDQVASLKASIENRITFNIFTGEGGDTPR